MLNEKGNVFDMFVRPQAYTQCIIVRNNDLKNKGVIEENSTGYLHMQHVFLIESEGENV